MLFVDASLLVDNPLDAGPVARGIEDAGYDGAYTFEGRHDPFMPLLAAAGSTSRLQLSTGIAVARTVVSDLFPDRMARTLAQRGRCLFACIHEAQGWYLSRA